MKPIKELLNSGSLELLRQGQSKKTYRMNDIVLGIVDTSQLSEQSPIFLRDSIDNYVSELKQCGVSTVDVLEIEAQGEHVVTVSRYMPDFLDHAMQKDKDSFLNGANQIFLNLLKIKEGSVGIDPTPKNFAISEGGILYADFYLPYTRQYIQEIRKQMNLDKPIDAYHYFSHDYNFYPLVFAHATSDLAETGKLPFNEALDLTISFCNTTQTRVNLTEMFGEYISRKSELKSRCFTTGV